MKEIKLLKLTMRDFQGGNFTIDIPGGGDATLWGANASGKTRLVSAFNWLLFGKDALGRSDFQLKNLNSDGEPEHNLQHSVEVILSIDGAQITLKNTYAETWTKKRGSPQATFTGHTNEFHIDGVPTQKKLFDQKVSEVTGPEENFRLLTMPTVFPGLPWQRQRALLLDVVGDLSDAEVIASDERLSSLPGILGKHTLEDYRKIVTVRRAEINKELTTIPVRIDEVNRSLPDITGINRGEAEQESKRLETSLNDAKLRLQGVNTSGNIADLSRTLQAINADLRKMEDGHRSGSLSAINRLNQQISETQAALSANSRRLNVLDGEIKSKQFAIKELDNTLSRLRTQWTAIDEEAFRDTTDQICLACLRPLPADQVEAARAKAREAFNGKKADALGEINRKGKEANNNRYRLEKDHEVLINEFNAVNLQVPELTNKLVAFTSERDTLKIASEVFTVVPGRADLLRQASEIEAEIKAERDGRAQDIEKIKTEIATLQDKLNRVLVDVHCFKTREQGEKRIIELGVEEKKLSKEYERLEAELYLSDLFIKTKVSLLTDRINSKFPTVRWKLFENLINGGVQEVCEMTIRGVGYSSGLNNAARIQGGLEIINALQESYGLRCPIFIDNRESITEIPKLNCQIISLVVSPDDKTLRVELG